MLPLLEDSTRWPKRGCGRRPLRNGPPAVLHGLRGPVWTPPCPVIPVFEQLEAILQDIAALALRLNKPLYRPADGPFPGKKAGEPTGLNFEYFANSKILEVPRQNAERTSGGDEAITILPRKQ